MRAGDPITSSISAIQTTLRKINPCYEWLPCPDVEETFEPKSAGAMATSRNPELTVDSSVFMAAPSPHWNFPQLEGPETGGSGGASEDLLDFTQSNMSWDLDFSTMDLEAFFSVYQPADAAL